MKNALRILGKLTDRILPFHDRFRPEEARIGFLAEQA